jgi:methylmalonyl-CoA/ethylmalonyl-CoA epimerase
MQIDRISHIGVAVRDLEEALRLYRDLLGLELAHTEEVPDQQVRVAMLRVGGTRIELLAPLAPDSPVGRFLGKQPSGGVHHIAYAVDDLEAALRELRSAGVALIDQAPRPGAHGARVAFLHPRSTGGVLTELCQEPRDPSGGPLCDAP